MRKFYYRFITIMTIAFFSVILVGCSKSNYKKHVGNDEMQVAAIIKDNGCLDCHAADAPTPFYGKLPIIGKVVKEDIVNGTRYIDIKYTLFPLERGLPVSEVDVAKIEYSAATGTMPPLKYSAMPIHWGKNLNKEEKAIIARWAAKARYENFASRTVVDEYLNEPIQPLFPIIVDAAKATLGEKLFHDTRLSADNTVSCATCHGLNTGGVDRLQFSKGIDGQLGGVNAPTVYNAVHNAAQFWDGRAADLQAQAAGPPLNPVEMGHVSFDDICAVLSKDKELVKEFNVAYENEGITQNSVTDAIAQFERTLITPSRFDKYLMGDKSAITVEEVSGYKAFKDNKCATCHVGIGIGGQSYEYMGVNANYFNNRGTGLTDGDNGRFAVTGNESDRHKFKTPILRNIAITYPYMHDGSVKTLEEAVDVMAEYQGGKKLSDNDSKSILAFLNSLTGEYKGQLLQ